MQNNLHRSFVNNVGIQWKMVFYLIKVKLSVDNVFCAVVAFLRHKAIVLMNSQIALDILISVIIWKNNTIRKWKSLTLHVSDVMSNVNGTSHITYKRTKWNLSLKMFAKIKIFPWKVFHRNSLSLLKTIINMSCNFIDNFAIALHQWNRNLINV